MKGKGSSKGRGKDGRGRGKGGGRPSACGRPSTPVPKRKPVPRIAGVKVDDCTEFAEDVKLMRRCTSCRHHVYGALHGAFLESMEGPTCGLRIQSIPRGGIATTPAEIQAALHKKGIIQAGDMFPEACLAPVQAVVRVPACSVPTCRTMRASPCVWWCNKHCYKIQLTDGRPIAVWCLQHDEIPVIRSAPVGEQFMNPDHLPSC
eukprot:6001124-Amphidinium_carterae.1